MVGAQGRAPRGTDLRPNPGPAARLWSGGPPTSVLHVDRDGTRAEEAEADWNAFLAAVLPANETSETAAPAEGEEGGRSRSSNGPGRAPYWGPAGITPPETLVSDAAGAPHPFIL